MLYTNKCTNCIYHIIIVIIIIGIQLLGRFGQIPEFSQATGKALVRCNLDKFLGVVCHCFPPCLDVPTFATRCLHVRHNARDPSGGKLNCRRECCPVMTTSTPFGDLLHAANLRHGTDGFTSPPKEGVLRIFSPLKILRHRSIIKFWSSSFSPKDVPFYRLFFSLTRSGLSTVFDSCFVFIAIFLFPAFYGTRRFITALTRARHLSLSWASSIQSITTWEPVSFSRRNLLHGISK